MTEKKTEKIIDGFSSKENVSDKHERTKEQVKNELTGLKMNVVGFYEQDSENPEKIKYDLEAVKSYLGKLCEETKNMKDREAWDYLNQGTRQYAWIMAVQIALESLGEGWETDVNKIDGLLGKAGSNTRKAVEKFQNKYNETHDNKLSPDGLPGRSTIKALLEMLGGSAANGGDNGNKDKDDGNKDKDDGNKDKDDGDKDKDDGDKDKDDGNKDKDDGDKDKDDGDKDKDDGNKDKGDESKDKEGWKAVIGKFDGDKFVFNEGVEKSDDNGKYIEYNGEKYYEYKDGMNGLGYQIGNGGFYIGEFKDGKYNGKGEKIWASGDVYKGDFVNGNREGKGKYTWPNGNVYEGDWKAGKLNGKGTFTWASGDVYKGDFVNDKRTGKGKCTWSDGTVYEGGYSDSKFEGEGKRTWPNGNILKGTWNDDFIGEGKIILKRTGDELDVVRDTTKESWRVTSEGEYKGRFISHSTGDFLRIKVGKVGEPVKADIPKVEIPTAPQEMPTIEKAQANALAEAEAQKQAGEEAKAKADAEKYPEAAELFRKAADAHFKAEKEARLVAEAYGRGEEGEEAGKHLDALMEAESKADEYAEAAKQAHDDAEKYL